MNTSGASGSVKNRTQSSDAGLKIATVVGARPQFVKSGPVSRAFDRIDRDGTISVEEILIHTGQHFDHSMSDVFFSELGLRKPTYNLSINSGSHGEMTGRMLAGLETVLVDERPDAVLIYGDTNSTLAAALAAAKLHIPIAHVEAGLRSRNTQMPEEINRTVADRISTWLFAPTDCAVKNLRGEGVPESSIIQCGDVMLDAAVQIGEVAGSSAPLLTRLSLRDGQQTMPFCLATIHRAENTDDVYRLGQIFDGLRQTAEQMPVVVPLHPRTRAALAESNMLAEVQRVCSVIEPLGYVDMFNLEKEAAVIVTDSGGVQKEAYFHKTPCVTLRTDTEWPELIDGGWNRLADPGDTKAITASIRAAIGTSGRDFSPYGVGDAGQHIASYLVRELTTAVLA